MRSHPLVGFGRLLLPVPVGTPLGGYVDRTGPSTGTLDPLEVSAVAFSHAGRTAVICVADVPVVHLDVVAATRERVAAAVDTVPDLVWLTATHTHAGPDTGCVPRGEPTPPPWDRVLPELAAAAAERALAAAVPADLTLHHGEITGIGGQRAGIRRGRTVPASLLCARAPATGDPLGALAVLAVHPTVLDAGNRLVSADLNGAVRRELSFQPGMWAAVATGAAGDMSTRPERRAQTADELDRLASIAGQQLRELAQRPAASRFDPGRPLAGTQSVVPLRARPALPPAERRAIVARARERQANAEQAGDLAAAREAAMAAQAVELAIAGGMDGSDLPCAIAKLDLAGIVLLGVGAEPYLDLARLADGAMLMGYANGYCGYLPTRDAFAYEDYEVLMAPMTAGEGERAVQMAVDLRPA